MTHDDGPLSIVEALGDEGLAKLAALGERLTLDAGTTLSEPGDPVEDQILVLAGAIEVLLVFDGGVERLVGTLRDGGLLGALAAGGLQTSVARARVSERAEVLRFPAGALDGLLAGDERLAVRVLPALLRQTARQAAIAVNDLAATAAWAAQISGLTQLSFGDLLASPAGVTLRLVDGRSLRGRILRVDMQDAGGHLVLDDGTGTLHVVRGAAIVSLERGPVGGPSA